MPRRSTGKGGRAACELRWGRAGGLAGPRTCGSTGAVIAEQNEHTDGGEVGGATEAETMI